MLKYYDSSGAEHVFIMNFQDIMKNRIQSFIIILTKSGMNNMIPKSISKPVYAITRGFLLILTSNMTVNAIETMRSAVYHNGGVKIRKVSVPASQSGQVRIKVHAASVNLVDRKIISKASGVDRTAGRDLSEVIDTLGPSTAGWKVSDTVTGISASGSYAEYAIASVDTMAAKSVKMSFAKTAW